MIVSVTAGLASQAEGKDIIFSFEADIGGAIKNVQLTGIVMQFISLALLIQREKIYLNTDKTSVAFWSKMWRKRSSAMSNNSSEYDSSRSKY